MYRLILLLNKECKPGMARKHSQTSIRFAASCFAHGFKDELANIDLEIETQVQKTAREGAKQLQLAIGLMGDLRIQTLPPENQTPRMLTKDDLWAW